MKVKAVKILFIIVAGIILIVGVPVAINEAYKANTGYLTLWTAADVLSYYGTILGAAATIGALIATILFTKRQIQRQSYIDLQEKKWDKIDALVSDALETIHPSRMNEILANAIWKDKGEVISDLHLYIHRLHLAQDSLIGNISSEDYNEIKAVVDGILNAAQQYSDIALELINLHSKFLQLRMRENAQTSLRIMQANPNTYDAKLADEYLQLIQEYGDLSNESINNEINKVQSKITELHHNGYINLLAQKRQTFSVITERRNQQANKILNLRMNS